MAYSVEAVGRRIQSQLLLRGITQQGLANKLGVSQAAVSRRLNGHSNFSASDLATIANWLGVSVAELFEPLPEQFELVEAVA